MSNLKLYVGTKEYFSSDVLDYVNRFFTNQGLDVIKYVDEKLVFQTSLNDKIQFLEKTINQLKGDKAFDFFFENRSEIKYSIDTTRNDIFVSLNTIIFLNEYNPFDSLNQNEHITLLGPEIYKAEYPPDYYQVILIDDYEKFIEIFSRLSHEIVPRLLDFILFEHFSYKLNNLRKQNEFLNPLKIQTNDINNLPEYCIIGVMVVIKEQITKNGSYFMYKGMKFDSSTQLEKHLKQNEEIPINSIRQYLDDSFGVGQQKDLYNPKRLKKIFEYCRRQNITIPHHIQSKYPELNN